MVDHVDSVKEYLRLMEGWRESAVNKGDQQHVQTYNVRLKFLRDTIAEIEELRRITKPIPASYGDLSDLPPELVKELTGVKVDELEQQLFTVIKSGFDEVDLDSILIELYRKFSVVQTRKFLQNKLWRMVQKGVISSVPGRKGVYTANGAANTASPASEPQKPTNPFDIELDDDVPF